MRKHIRVVTPIVTESFRSEEDLSPLAGAETEISHVRIERGPASIESEFDEAFALPDTLARIIEAEREGVDAVVIDCMGDPALFAAREVVSIPVLGPAETSMHVAAMLGHKFSVVTVLDTLKPFFENRAKVYSVIDKLVSVRSVDIPVLELDQDRERLVDALVEESRKAVVDDGADVIIFGCTGLLTCAEMVQRGLESIGQTGVPVIDPVPTAIKLAEALVDLRLAHSKRTYPFPPLKHFVGYERPEPVAVSV